MSSTGQTGNAPAGAPDRPLISPRLQAKIIETVSLNRVTIIVGPTGSGKSTQVPQLLMALKGRILCSQPRRLAVVAIARRVAEEKGVPLGGTTVGFQIGSKNLSSKKTQVLFTTAGILLEELRNNGVDALSKFRCVIIDECHERSPESDLVLSLVRRLMKTHPRQNIRIILMSATFNHARYVSYFRGVPGCSTIDTITLETAESFDAFHKQVSTYYLENLPLAESEKQLNAGFIQKMLKRPDDDLQADDGKSLTDGMLSLIRSLVSTLDEEEPSEAPFLIFVPTYRHLEQIYTKICYINEKKMALSVLHSAVDIEDCIRTMSSSAASHKNSRRILLASAIADSSVTIPGVTVVIDLCRSLQVQWDVDTRTHAARTVWCSQSIADQRRGRTGRTCPGRVFRLLPNTFFLQRLPTWEVPQLTLGDCHDQILAMITADEKVRISDPRELLRECLDSPSPEVLDDAIDYLEEIGACIRVREGLLSRTATVRVEPTTFGSLMASLPMAVQEARIVIEGARVGLLHETLALVALYNHKPAPIVHHFNEPDRNHFILESFYPDAQANFAPSLALANLAAYLYWDMHWNHNYNVRKLDEYRSLSRARGTNGGVNKLHQENDPWHWTEEDDEDHVAWCRERSLNPTSMRSIKETIETSMNVFYRRKFEPDWLESCDQTPKWKDHEFVALSHSRPTMRETLRMVYGEKYPLLAETLTKLVLSKSAVNALPTALELLGRCSAYPRVQKKERTGPLACIHFLMGSCQFGSDCRNAHSFAARRPPCRFFMAGRCSKGQDCIFSHSGEEQEMTVNAFGVEGGGALDPLLPCMKSWVLPNIDPMFWFRKHASTLLLLGEGNFQFTKALCSMGYPPFATTTDTPSPTGMFANALIGVDATLLHQNRQVSRLIPDSGVVQHFAWNFPFVTGAADSTDDENYMQHEALILHTFQSLVLLFQEKNTYQNSETLVTFALTLQGDQFSRWNVTRSAWRTGWRLTGWCPFNHDDFEGYHPSRQNGDTFPVEAARFYVFTRWVGPEVFDESE